MAIWNMVKAQKMSFVYRKISIFFVILGIYNFASQRTRVHPPGDFIWIATGCLKNARQLNSHNISVKLKTLFDSYVNSALSNFEFIKIHWLFRHFLSSLTLCAANGASRIQITFSQAKDSIWQLCKLGAVKLWVHENSLTVSTLFKLAACLRGKWSF